MYYTTLTWGKKEEYKYSEETEGKIRHNSKHSRSLIIETSWYRHCIFFIFSYWNALSSGLFRAHIHPCTHSLTPHQRHVHTNKQRYVFGVHCAMFMCVVYGGNGIHSSTLSQFHSRCYCNTQQHSLSAYMSFSFMDMQNCFRFLLLVFQVYTKLTLTSTACIRARLLLCCCQAMTALIVVNVHSQ